MRRVGNVLLLFYNSRSSVAHHDELIALDGERGEEGGEEAKGSSRYPWSAVTE